MRALATVAGFVVVLVVWLSVLRTVFAPQERSSYMARATASVVGAVMLSLARRLREPVREYFLGYATPLMLLAMVTLWLAADLAGFVLIGWGLDGVTASAFWASGTAPVAWISLLLLVALFTVHLVRVTSAYCRRESPIGRLSTRATRSLDAESILADYLRSGDRDQFSAFLGGWSNWLADVQASHLAYPALTYYRSAGSMCWTGAVQILLDCAALAEACAPGWAPPEAASLLIISERCLPRLTGRLGIKLPPVSVSYQGREGCPFSRTLTTIRKSGLPIEVDDQRAQREFQRLRVRYAPFTYAICERLLYEYTDL
jgi:hypothetical protein